MRVRLSSEKRNVNGRKSGAVGMSDPATVVSFDLSKRLRNLRGKHGLSLEAVASRTGLTKGFLSMMERGLKAPSISTLLRLSHAYDMPIGALLDGSKPSEPAYSLVRRGERRKYAREGSLYGYRYEAIAFRKDRKLIEPFIVSPPMRTPRKFFTHDGDEMVFVLAGQVEIQLDKDHLRLLPGDCLYFDGTTPHRSRSVGAKRAITLVAVAES
jgi:transcriptional regulator with XRE-family HTH domain